MPPDDFLKQTGNTTNPAERTAGRGAEAELHGPAPVTAGRDTRSMAAKKRNPNLPGPLELFGVAVTAMFALAGIIVKTSWYDILLAAVLVAGIFIGRRRRIFRPGVKRVGDDVICRYIPWYESMAYLCIVVLPLLGVVFLRSPHADGRWFRFAGGSLLGLGATVAAMNIFVWITYRVRITPTTLAVSVGRSSVIPRDRVQSIATRTFRSWNTGNEWTSIDIVYRPTDATSKPTKTLMLGTMWFSIEPANLIHALNTWRYGDADDPGLMDHVEAILRDPGK